MFNNDKFQNNFTKKLDQMPKVHILIVCKAEADHHMLSKRNTINTIIHSTINIT